VAAGGTEQLTKPRGAGLDRGVRRQRQHLVSVRPAARAPRRRALASVAAQRALTSDPVGGELGKNDLERHRLRAISWHRAKGAKSPVDYLVEDVLTFIATEF